MYDEIIIEYYKIYKFLFFSFGKTYKEKIAFRRTAEDIPDRPGYKNYFPSSELDELKKQLEDHKKSLSKGYYLTDIEYKIIKDKIPEIFL